MKKFLYIAALALVGLTSCEDELNKRPLAAQDLDNYFASATDMELFSNRWYYNLYDGEPWTTQEDTKFNRTISDLLKMGTARTTPQSGGGWTWTVLRSINTLLEIAPKNCSDQAALKKYTALARYCRAQFYFTKVKRFGDVPWIDRQLGSDDPALTNARDSREYILTKMLEDIDYAIENLPSNEGPYYITQAAALMLKSNFCLYEGTFRKYHEIDLTAGGTSVEGEAYEGHDWKYYLNQSIDAAEKLMNGGKFKLYSTNNPNVDYRDLFASHDLKKDEIIFGILYNQEPAKTHNINWWSIGANSSGPQFGRKFVCTYLMKDGSRFTDTPGWQTMTYDQEMVNRDPRLAQTMRCPGYKRIGGTDVLPADLGVSFTGYQPVKFVMESAVGDYDCDRTDRCFNDVPVFRYAECLLNYAEAKAELEQLTQADLDKSINLIRKRAGMPDMKVGNSVDPYLISEEFGYFNSEKAGAQQGDVLEIRRERSIEMAMENRRWDDLMRWKSGKSWSQNLYGMYIPGPCQLDVTGDGKADIVFYAEGSAKPSVAKGVVAYEIGKEITLSEKTKGYINMHNSQVQGKFDEARDYYYPIPLDDLTLNPNLTQNPGWDVPR